MVVHVGGCGLEGLRFGAIVANGLHFTNLPIVITSSGSFYRGPHDPFHGSGVLHIVLCIFTVCAKDINCSNRLSCCGHLVSCKLPLA